MLNLAYPIDDVVEINGKEYKIDLSFDNVLRLFDMLNDKTLADIHKVALGLKMLLDTEFDLPIEDQTKIFIELFDATVGRDQEEKQSVDLDGNPMPSPTGDNKKVYDLVQDAEYIYASFMSDYNIDLIEVQGKLHWLKFKALLNGLTESSMFSRVVGIRTTEPPTGKGAEKERERIRKLQRQFALKEE